MHILCTSQAQYYIFALQGSGVHEFEGAAKHPRCFRCTCCLSHATCNGCMIDHTEGCASYCNPCNRFNVSVEPAAILRICRIGCRRPWLSLLSWHDFVSAMQGFFVPYFTGAIVLVVLAVGSTAPGLLALVIGRFAQVFPDYRERVLRHEAAHFLVSVMIVPNMYDLSTHALAYNIVLPLHP